MCTHKGSLQGGHSRVTPGITPGLFQGHSGVSSGVTSGSLQGSIHGRVERNSTHNNAFFLEFVLAHWISKSAYPSNLLSIDDSVYRVRSQCVVLSYKFLQESLIIGDSLGGPTWDLGCFTLLALSLHFPRALPALPCRSTDRVVILSSCLQRDDHSFIHSFKDLSRMIVLN